MKNVAKHLKYNNNLENLHKIVKSEIKISGEKRHFRQKNVVTTRAAVRNAHNIHFGNNIFVMGLSLPKMTKCLDDGNFKLYDTGHILFC